MSPHARLRTQNPVIRTIFFTFSMHFAGPLWRALSQSSVGVRCCALDMSQYPLGEAQKSGRHHHRSPHPFLTRGGGCEKLKGLPDREKSHFSDCPGTLCECRESTKTRLIDCFSIPESFCGREAHRLPRSQWFVWARHPKGRFFVKNYCLNQWIWSSQPRVGTHVSIAD